MRSGSSGTPSGSAVSGADRGVPARERGGRGDVASRRPLGHRPVLGFRRPSLSSIDAVSDRDAASDVFYASVVALLHASGFAEELVLGSLPGVDRVASSDPFVTTSSLMPHKRTLDLAELVRAQSAPAIGRLVSHLTLLKGLPIGYQRDLQVGKPLVLEGLARARLSLDVLAAMASGTTFLAPRRPTPRPGRSSSPMPSSGRASRSGRRTGASRSGWPAARRPMRGTTPSAPRNSGRFPSSLPDSGFPARTRAGAPRQRGRVVVAVGREAAHRGRARSRAASAGARRERTRLERLRRASGIPERLFSSA